MKFRAIFHRDTHHHPETHSLELRDEFWWRFNYFSHQIPSGSPSKFIAFVAVSRFDPITPTRSFLIPPFHDDFYWSLIITETNTWCFQQCLQVRGRKSEENRHRFTQRYAFINLEDASESAEGVEVEHPSVKHVQRAIWSSATSEVRKKALKTNIIKFPP